MNRNILIVFYLMVFSFLLIPVNSVDEDLYLNEFNFVESQDFSEYTVQIGDSLESIINNVVKPDNYNDRLVSAKVIYEANKDVLGDDFKLETGENLKIPKSLIDKSFFKDYKMSAEKLFSKEDIDNLNFEKIDVGDFIAKDGEIVEATDSDVDDINKKRENAKELVKERFISECDNVISLKQNSFKFKVNEDNFQITNTRFDLTGFTSFVYKKSYPLKIVESRSSKNKIKIEIPESLEDIFSIHLCSGLFKLVDERGKIVINGYLDEDNMEASYRNLFKKCMEQVEAEKTNLQKIGSAISNFFHEDEEKIMSSDCKGFFNDYKLYTSHLNEYNQRRSEKYIVNLKQNSLLVDKEIFNKKYNILETVNFETSEKFLVGQEIRNSLTEGILSINFVTAGYDLSDGDKEDLDELSRQIIRNKINSITLKATTDKRGSVEYNKKLAKNRMDSVANYLKKKVVSLSGGYKLELDEIVIGEIDSGDSFDELANNRAVLVYTNPRNVFKESLDKLGITSDVKVVLDLSSSMNIKIVDKFSRFDYISSIKLSDYIYGFSSTADKNFKDGQDILTVKPTGATPIYTALYALSKDDKIKEGDKVVLISDGENTLSDGVSLRDLIDELIEKKISLNILVIHPNPRLEKIVYLITELTGGNYVTIKSLNI